MTNRIHFEEDPVHESEQRGGNRWVLLILVIIVILLFAGLVFGASNLLRNPEKTETLRDVMIIVIAFETLFIGFVLILLIVQVARLTTILQNEIRPIIDSANETINTLRGTSKFLSENMVQPVMKANSSLAAIRHALNLLRPGRSK